MAHADKQEDQAPHQEFNFSERLDRLFKIMRPDHPEEWTLREVAEGTGLSISYLSVLRRGERDNPSRDQIEALAAFFKVSPAYFFPDPYGDQISRELEAITTLRSAGVEETAFHLAQLSVADRQLVERIIRRLGTQKAE